MVESLELLSPRPPLPRALQLLHLLTQPDNEWLQLATAGCSWGQLHRLASAGSTAVSCSLPARVFVESTQLGEMERSKTPCYRGCSNPGHASLSFKFRHVTAVGSNPTSCNVFVCFYFSACPLALIMLDARCDCRQVGGFSSLHPTPLLLLLPTVGTSGGGCRSRQRRAFIRC